MLRFNRLIQNSSSRNVSSLFCSSLIVSGTSVRGLARGVGKRDSSTTAKTVVGKLPPTPSRELRPVSLSHSSLRSAAFSSSFAPHTDHDVASLIDAAARGDPVQVRRLVEQDGIPATVKDYDYRTPLHLACAEGHLNVVQLLISYGADINAVDRFGNVPYEDASRQDSERHKATRELLLAHGAKLGTSAVVRRRGTPEFHGAMNKALAALAERGGWDCAEAWVLNAAGDRLECSSSASYFSSRMPKGAAKQLRSTVANRSLSADDGGCVVQAWLREKAYWIEDVSDPSADAMLSVNRGDVLRSLGLRAAATVPVLSDGEVTVVLVFFAMEARKKDAALLDQLSQVSLGLIHTGLSSSHRDTPSSAAAAAAAAASGDDPHDHDGEDAAAHVASGAGTLVDRAGDGRHTELMNRLYRRLCRQGVFSSTMLYEEVDWFINGLRFNDAYFIRFTEKEITNHIQLYVAAKKTAQAEGHPEEIFLDAPTHRGRFYVLPDTYAAMNRVEDMIEKEISSLPPHETYSIASFRSRGPALPASADRRHLLIYIFDRAEFVHKPSPEDMSGQNEFDIYKLATADFLREKTKAVIDRYQSVLKSSVGRLAPSMDVARTTGLAGEDTPYRTNVLIGVRTDLSLLSTISEAMENAGLAHDRRFVETFSNGLTVYSIYLLPDPADGEFEEDDSSTTSRTVPPSQGARVQRFLKEVSLLQALPRSILTQRFLDDHFTTEEYAYATLVGRCIYYFLNRKSDEYQALANAFADEPANLARLELLHMQLRTAAVTPARINMCFMRNEVIVKALYDDFHRRCNPDQSAESMAANGSSEVPAELSAMIRRQAVDEIDDEILTEVARLNAFIDKTNFFARRKASLAFRVPGDYVTGFPATPFAVFFVLGPDFQAFHVRFRDVARGGIRIIPFTNPQAYSHNAETQFSETFNLAYTQNKKNKDIPEFGSKGTILLYPHALQTPSARFLCFQRFVAGLLDLVLPRIKEDLFDRHRGASEQELLFLGPDEHTADCMEWAALYARSRGSPFWKAFTTGKPPTIGGIPHDRYAMTTRSVHRYVLGCLEKAGLREEDVTKLQTGGPDGDLGSNEILISKDRTVAIVDGAGVIYDPAGIDREEIARCARLRVTCQFFDVSKLGPGGFRVLTTDRDITLPDGEHVESGLVFRNEFHLHPLSTADLFVPCGGRPASITISNVHRMFHQPDKAKAAEDSFARSDHPFTTLDADDRKDQPKPRFRFIIEGANLFLTQDARNVLESAGVIVYKDASANKGGVTSSSLEVLAALALTDAEFHEHMTIPETAEGEEQPQAPEFYMRYVAEVQQRVEHNADLEFEAIWRENERTGHSRTHLTDKVSMTINELNDEIQASSLYDDEFIRRGVLAEAVPAVLQQLIGLDQVMERVPDAYLRATFSCFLASRFVYTYGPEAPFLAFFEYMRHFSSKKSANALEKAALAKEFDPAIVL